jgi:hypothetical protein
VVYAIVIFIDGAVLDHVKAGYKVKSNIVKFSIFGQVIYIHWTESHANEGYILRQVCNVQNNIAFRHAENEWNHEHPLSLRCC